MWADKANLKAFNPLGIFNSVVKQQLIILPFASQLDVATDNLLNIEDSVNVVVETNGNMEEDQLDNHRPPETNNNPAWVGFSSSALPQCLKWQILTF